MATDLHLRALFDPDAFAEEQRRLGEVWTFLGFASDVPRENDWFRASLGGRSVFVQRFAGGLRGFENRCAHRSYPLRTAERGNGPILCGFHHWRYDSEGVAAGIPNCQDAFGTAPRALGRSLAKLDVACCGDMIFARFPRRPETGPARTGPTGTGPAESLESFLGPTFEILQLLCKDMRGAARARRLVRANWRLVQWISLDEYHLAAVHPGSFGSKGRYLPRKALNYMALGAHSAYFLGASSGSLDDWSALLRDGSKDAVGYRIIHLFPGTALLLPPEIRALGQSFRYIVILTQVPLGFDRTETRAAILRLAPDGRKPSLLTRIFDMGEPVRAWLATRAALSILGEDHAICETLQQHARQIADDPIYGAAEIRVGWFNEAYAAAMRPGEPPA